MAQQKNPKPNDNRSKEDLNLPSTKPGKESGKKRDNLPPKPKPSHPKPSSPPKSSPPPNRKKPSLNKAGTEIRSWEG